MYNVFRFTLIFAHTIEAPAADFLAPLAAIIAEREAEIFGLTVWPSHGWTRPYGCENTLTVEFVAPLRRAVEFSAGVATWYAQDCVYLASGSAAVLVDSRGRIIETLAGARIAGELPETYNTNTEIIG